MTQNSYQSPLASRYASKRMLYLFSPLCRAITWRKLWAALAEAEQALGLPITDAQIQALNAHTEDIDFEVIAAREREVRHDVMAHIHAYGEAAPEARGVIHLGATSCFVTDNADIIIYRDALRLIRGQLLGVMAAMRDFAGKYAALPTLGYTHFQPAQPVTVGKRASLWLQDLLWDLQRLDGLLDRLRLLGSRGATGTEASFTELFNGDEKKADELNELLSRRFGFPGVYPVCGQTYPRKLDSFITDVLSGIAQSAYRFANDIRLLQHERELEEPFESNQIGSSAMAYKRNPMRCERICSLSRYVVTAAQNPPLTASTQWLERTLDDSANRRIALPECFLSINAVLRLMKNVASGLVVNEKVIAKHLQENLPFLATENLLMEAVKRGGDRQALHELIRAHSMKAAERIKNGEPPMLLESLAEDAAFPLNESDMQLALEPSLYTGRAETQTLRFIASLPDLSLAANEEDITL